MQERKTKIPKFSWEFKCWAVKNIYRSIQYNSLVNIFLVECLKLLGLWTCKLHWTCISVNTVLEFFSCYLYRKYIIFVSLKWNATFINWVLNMENIRGSSTLYGFWCVLIGTATFLPSEKSIHMFLKTSLSPVFNLVLPMCLIIRPNYKPLLIRWSRAMPQIPSPFR